MQQNLWFGRKEIEAVLFDNNIIIADGSIVTSILAATNAGTLLIDIAS